MLLFYYFSVTVKCPCVLALFLYIFAFQWTPPKKKRKNKPLQFPISAKKVCTNESVSETTNVDLLISRMSERFKELLDELEVGVVLLREAM